VGSASAAGGAVLSTAVYVAVAAGVPQADKAMVIKTSKVTIVFIFVSFHIHSS
jgi:hypothetical protein